MGCITLSFVNLLFIGDVKLNTPILSIVLNQIKLSNIFFHFGQIEGHLWSKQIQHHMSLWNLVHHPPPAGRLRSNMNAAMTSGYKMNIFQLESGLRWALALWAGVVLDEDEKDIYRNPNR